MNPIDIKTILSIPFSKPEDVKTTPKDLVSDFKNLVAQSMNDLDIQMTQANQSVQEMLMGRKDIHQTMVDMEMAGISLRTVIQFRNKIIAAYEEIMRMQF